MAAIQETTQHNETTLTNGTATASLLSKAQTSLTSPHDVTCDPEDTGKPVPRFQDSGFFEDNGNPADYVGGGDWTLFDEDGTGENEYSFTEDDVLDIASMKANHGSTYEGTNNRTTTQIPEGTSCAASGGSGERTAFYDPIRDAARPSEIDEEGPRPQHSYSTQHGDLTAGTSLHTWASTFERNESIAYRSRQLPNPTAVFHILQFWEEDIVLEDFRQPYY